MSLNRFARRLRGRLLGRPAQDLPDRWKSALSTLGSSETDRQIIQAVRPYTMTGPYRIQALLDAVEHLVESGTPGALAECGVWRGGSVLAMLMKLAHLDAMDREVYLYDTFEGMTDPTELDVSDYEASALDTWEQARGQNQRPWNEFFDPKLFNETQVRELLVESGYPAQRLHFVQGPVEETIPATLPEQIALLRLDTDWYESTRHELIHLYPLISPGGVLIIDDYGHWKGCRKAVEEYFGRDPKTKPFFQRIDYSARLAVKA